LLLFIYFLHSFPNFVKLVNGLKLVGILFHIF